MYIFINEELEMSRGKLGAQTGHAAVQAYKISTPYMIEQWELGGHYTKLVMRARNAEHLRTIERYIRDRLFDTVMIIDEGRTEIAPLSPTALGVEIVDRDDPHTKATFEHFETLKDTKPTPGTKEPLVDELMDFVNKVGSDPGISVDTLLEIRKLFMRR